MAFIYLLKTPSLTIGGKKIMKDVSEKVLSIFDDDYQNWIDDLKKRYKQSQIKAAIKVNSELIHFYWSLGRDIVKMKSESRWGSKFYESLSKDLRNAFPDATGFSRTNIIYMKQFYELFPENEISQQVVDQLFFIPWGHITLIVSKVKKSTNKAAFYIRKTIENNWSRSVLSCFLDTNLYERSQDKLTNFKTTLPEENSDLANELIKDPYNFNFLAIDDRYTEKELKDALINNIQKFLLELGTGFAFIGKEYRLQVGQTEQFLDMLFYNTQAHAYVVLEVKTTNFKPEFVGQLGTYVVAVDHILKTERDEKTIGILVCKDKDNVLARYSLDSSSQPLGVSSFELSKLIPENFKSSLPTVEEIENELKLK